MQDYALVFIADERMQGASPMPLGATVRPKQTLQVSVQLTAPDSAGRHRGIWLLQDIAGNRFGSGPNGNQPFWVQILINESEAQIVPRTSPGSASLKLNNAYYAGTCPVSLVFNATVSMNQTETAEFQLDMGTADPEYKLNPPDAQNHSFVAGDILTVDYPILLTHSVDGWAQVHMTSPHEFFSNKISFSVHCK
jgi:hypothetical protein